MRAAQCVPIARYLREATGGNSDIYTRFFRIAPS